MVEALLERPAKTDKKISPEIYISAAVMMPPSLLLPYLLSDGYGLGKWRWKAPLNIHSPWGTETFNRTLTKCCGSS